MDCDFFNPINTIMLTIGLQYIILRSNVKNKQLLICNNLKKTYFYLIKFAYKYLNVLTELSYFRRFNDFDAYQ